MPTARSLGLGQGRQQGVLRAGGQGRWGRTPPQQEAAVWGQEGAGFSADPGGNPGDQAQGSSGTYWWIQCK